MSMRNQYGGYCDSQSVRVEDDRVLTGVEAEVLAAEE
jgi:hypothetical protein